MSLVFCVSRLVRRLLNEVAEGEGDGQDWFFRVNRRRLAHILPRPAALSEGDLVICNLFAYLGRSLSLLMAPEHYIHPGPYFVLPVHVVLDV